MASNDIFEKESVSSAIIKLAIPTIVSSLVTVIYNLADTYFVGLLNDPVQTAAVTLAAPALLAFNAINNLFGVGTSSAMSRALGRGDSNLVRRCSVFGLYCAFISSVLFSVFTGLFRTPLLGLLGASAKNAAATSEYMRWAVTCGAVPSILNVVFAFLVRSEGSSLHASIGTMSGCILNIILDPILIFACDMGVRGAALATVISQTVSAAWVLWFVCSTRSTLRLRVQYLRISPRVMASVLALGLSPFIMQSTESLVQIAFNTSMQSYGGDLYVSAIVIMSSVMQFFTMPVMGFAQGAQPIIGFNYGAGNYDRVKSAAKYCAVFCLAFSLLLWGVAVFFPKLPVRVFTDDPAVVELAAQIMPVFFLGMAIFGVQLALQQVFIALGQAKVSIFIALLRKLILLIPLVIILPHFITPATDGVVLAEPIADITAATTCCLLFAYKYRTLLRTSNKQA